MDKMTRAQAVAIAGSVLRAGTAVGRERAAAQFVNDVFAAIAAENCSDHYFCARLAIDTWLNAAAESDPEAGR
jgi:hypothetical protein